MENALINYGLPALFVVSFLAATLIPVGSEWLLVAFIIKTGNIESAVTVATLGNYLGACTTYFIGAWGSVFLIKKVLGMDENKLNRATHFYNRYGSWSLLFSWVPIIGDPLCLVGGVLRLNFVLFSLFVFAGKLARYSIVAAVTAGALN